MSRAFVREDDQGSEPLPDRLISPHANLVTPKGLLQLDARAKELEADLVVARGAEDRDALARIARDLRYYRARRASARVVATEPDPQVVRFGVQVVLRLADGSQRCLRIVGEDEADPSAGCISHVSPLAQALFGLASGSTLSFSGGMAEVERLEP